MKQGREAPWILTCRRPPALFTRSEVKDRLGLHDEDAVSKIVKARLLPFLGGRKGNQQLWFFADDVEVRAHDRNWLDRIVKLLYAGEKQKGPKLS
jgi:hypothetical protein